MHFFELPQLYPARVHQGVVGDGAYRRSKVLNAAMPSTLSISSMRQCMLSIAHSRRIWGAPRHRTSTRPMVQRQNASATGGTIPTLDRPTMKLPDQNRTASVNRMYGARQTPDNRECIETARPDTRACAASFEGERDMMMALRNSMMVIRIDR